MASVARMKVAKMLISALALEGLRVNGMHQVAKVADDIWFAEGGATKLDVARWGVDCMCSDNGGTLRRIHVSSFSTLRYSSMQQKLTIIGRDGYTYEV